MTSSPSITFTLVATEDGEFITVYAPGRAPLPADSSHPNFSTIKDRCLASLQGEVVSPDEVADLFDVAETVERKFQPLSDRVAVRGGQILLDGDPVNGRLQDQILDFLDSGEDFDPLVRFYEKLTSNPIQDVRETLFAFIDGQTDAGIQITEDGDLVAYKGVWTEGEGYRPSRKNTASTTFVNDREVAKGEYTVQQVGDTVSMPRAEVSEPSRECGVGLHVGTLNYAKTFGPVLLRVKFSPRDVVSAPDGASSWKVRVIRYTVLDVIENPDEAVASPVYRTADVDGGEDDGLDVVFEQSSEGDLGPAQEGDRVKDDDGDEGTVEGDGHGGLQVRYDNPTFGQVGITQDDVSDDSTEKSGAIYQRTGRPHGKGGPTSQAAKGNGRNPAQDAKGRFSGGRPGSTRDASTGRFA